MPDATVAASPAAGFTRADLTTFCRLDELGLEVDPATDFGPLSSEKAAQTFVEQIDDAVSKSATLRTGGKRVEGPGAFVEATVLTDVTPQMRAFSEEIFGPGVVIYRVADADEAIELANSSAFGLGGVVYSKDPQRAQDVADRARHRDGGCSVRAEEGNADDGRLA